MSSLDDDLRVKKILIIDDSSLSRMMIVKKIKNISDKFEIVQASGGNEGIDKIASLKENNDMFDIVFLDHLMPKMNGIETLKIIRDLYPDLSVVMITANVQKTVKEEAEKYGCHGFIHKTTEDEYLADILESL